MNPKNTIGDVQAPVVALQQRGVWHEVNRNGMAWLNAYLPAEKLALAMAALDAAAFEGFREADETRTMSQLRADILADLLIVDGDPSADISVLADPEKINAVLKAGVVVHGALPQP